MAKLVWDETGTRNFETGVSQGVLYYNPQRTNTGEIFWANGVAWDGLISVSESPSGGEPTELYADDIKYGVLRSIEDVRLTIEAYAYPEQFNSCLGFLSPAEGLYVSGQTRSPFALVYKTKMGDDEHPGIDANYKLHAYFNLMATSSERSYQTINDSPDAITFSFECTANKASYSNVESERPVAIAGLTDTTRIIIDRERYIKAVSTGATKLRILENTLFGSNLADASLARPTQFINRLL